jgi:hypothetical protein
LKLLFNPISGTAIEELKTMVLFRKMICDPAPIRIGDFRAADYEQSESFLQTREIEAICHTPSFITATIAIGTGLSGSNVG